MPIFVAALIGALAQAAASLTGRVLLALGIGYVAYTGISVALDGLMADIVSNMSGLPATMISVLTATKCDVATKMIFSAITARLTIQGLTSGAIKRMVVK